MSAEIMALAVWNADRSAVAAGELRHRLYLSVTPWPGRFHEALRRLGGFWP
jgi:hypothetical protein